MYTGININKKIDEEMHINKYPYPSSGNVFLCAKYKCVAVLKQDEKFDIYNFKNKEEWLNLLHTHKVCFVVYTMHDEWIKEYEGRFLNQAIPICMIIMNTRYETDARVRFFDRNFRNPKTTNLVNRYQFALNHLL